MPIISLDRSGMIDGGENEGMDLSISRSNDENIGSNMSR